MWYHLVHGLAVVKDTDPFYLRKHRILIRDIDALPLIHKVNSPGKAMQHFFPEAWGMEERSVEILIYPERVYVQTFAFSLKSLYKGNVLKSQRNNF